MPRVPRPALVVAFPTTAAAMSCEELCQSRGLPGRMIPVPGQVSAGCGLAWKAAPEDRVLLESALSEAGISVEGFFTVELLEFVRE